MLVCSRHFSAVILAPSTEQNGTEVPTTNPEGTEVLTTNPEGTEVPTTNPEYEPGLRTYGEPI